MRILRQTNSSEKVVAGCREHTVALAHRRFPSPGKSPLLILHGLLGSSRNWIPAARKLTQTFDVYALDLRNHGSSPHHQAMDFASLSADVGAFMDKEGLSHSWLLGHSLGGKVAMRFACDYPARTAGLIIADIAPRDYGLHFKEDFEAMLALDLKSLQTRKEADDALAPAIPNWAFRQFLLTNLERDPDGGLRWLVNLPVLAQSLPIVRCNPLLPEESVSHPVLFLKGEESDFVLEEDHPKILHHFPSAQIESIANAGHNIHADQAEAFVRSVTAYFKSIP